MKKRLWTCLVFLITGAAVNVLVAMACARWGVGLLNSGVAVKMPVSSVPPEAEEHLYDKGRLALFRPDPPTDVTVSTSGTFIRTSKSYVRRLDQSGGYSRTHTFEQFGLPLRSLFYEAQSAFMISGYAGVACWRIPGWRGGWPLESSEEVQDWGTYVESPYFLPLTPMPLGFAANSIFYAGLLFAVTLMPGLFRRRSRRRRGLCVACGYPRGVSAVCTECGAGVGRGVPHSGQGLLSGEPTSE